MSKRKRAAEITLKYISEDVDRHGNVRVYFRKPGRPKVRLRAPLGTNQFIVEYQAALNGTAAYVEPEPHARARSRDTMSWLCTQYYQSAEFRQLQGRTQHVRRLILERFCADHGDKQYSLLEPKHVRRFRDKKVATPEAANGLIKALRQVFAVALAYDLVKANPAAQVGYLRSGSEGFHSWTEAEIATFEGRHPIGTRARLAFALLLYTAQRRSDVVRFGPKMLKNGFLCFVQKKNQRRKPVSLEIPVSPELMHIIQQTPGSEEFFLTNTRGRPFTEETFGNWFRKKCDEAGLVHCTAHGLRKAAARRLAEAGASEHEIMSWTGHTTSKEVTRYTRATRQRVLAVKAAELRPHQPAKDVPPSPPLGGSGTPDVPKRLKLNDIAKKVVPGTGIEPVTRGFSIRCSTN